MNGLRAAPLIITPKVMEQLHKLRDEAPAQPVDVRAVLETIKTKHGEQRHRARMAEMTVHIPGPFVYSVTYSIETGHPAGMCRHMSMSINRGGRVPSPEAVWLVAQELGFTGSIGECVTWQEAIGRGDYAINVVQPLPS